MNEPRILDETDSFAVVFKPPRMHCAPLRGNNAEPDGKYTLLDWYTAIFPPVLDLTGRKEGEGGLLHRLDYETQGLVLFAKNQMALDNLLNQQNEGYFVKEYSAVCYKNESCSMFQELLTVPFPIESYFRPFGPGRKQVRPVTDEDCNKKKRTFEVAKDRGAYYRTAVTGYRELNCGLDPEKRYLFTARIERGFRHQIRCHLAWIGYPVLNDPLYGTGVTDGFLALRAIGLFFKNPGNGKAEKYEIESLIF